MEVRKGTGVVRFKTFFLVLSLHWLLREVHEGEI